MTATVSVKRGRQMVIPDASIAGSKGILKGVYSYDLIKERRKLRKKEHSKNSKRRN